MHRLLVVVVCCLVLMGCATPKKTTVVLIPDDDDHLGNVVVSTAKERHVLETCTDTAVVGEKRVERTSLDMRTITRIFGPALQAQPTPPESHLLYFATGSAEPLPDSLATLPKVTQAIQSRPEPTITLIGHSDQAGDPAKNLQLSMDRAARVKTLLEEQGIASSRMVMEAYGANAPLVPTPAGVAEPRNRRVEIFVR